MDSGQQSSTAFVVRICFSPPGRWGPVRSCFATESTSLHWVGHSVPVSAGTVTCSLSQWAPTPTARSGHRGLIDGSHGPVITTAIRVPDEADGGEGRGYYVQEAGFPEFANWLIETTQVTASMERASKTIWELIKRRMGSRYESTMSAEVSRLVGEGRIGSDALPLLGMGRDVPDGRITLRDGELDIDWTSATSMSFFSSMRATMRSISDALNATYHDNPLWWTKRVVTVHPLGGTPMGRSIHEGVTDSHGESFGHSGLFVVDGSVMPGPVGANPAFTIAALANRTADYVLSRPKPKRPVVRKEEATQPTAITDEPPSDAPSIRFTEQMKGYLALDESDPVTGWERARQLGHRFAFELTIAVPDVEGFVAAGDHPGTADGFVRCELLGGRLPVERGWFNLFVATDEADTREMRYRLWVRDISGAPVTMYGYKSVRDDQGLDLWSDTSTLYITLLNGHIPPGANGEVIGAGVLRILIRDFLKQLTTFRASGPAKAGSFATFGQFFAKSLRDIYFAPARPPEPPRTHDA